MKRSVLILATLASPLGFLTLGCSATLGDAAYRGGHFPQAAALYESEANRGDSLAASKLGDLYYNRPGLPEDHQKAVFWYEKAVGLGQIPPMWSIGKIYRDGTDNVPRDIAKARQWFERGAEKGQHYSMYDLAALHADGMGSATDDVNALMWFEAVTAFAKLFPANNGGAQFVLRDPLKIKVRLESRMSAPDIEKSKQMARAWVATFMATEKRK